MPSSSFLPCLLLLLEAFGGSTAAVRGVFPGGLENGFSLGGGGSNGPMASRSEVSRHLSEIMPEVGFGLEAAEELGLQAGPQAAAGLRQEMPRIDVSWCIRSLFITNPATRDGSRLPFFFHFSLLF